MMRKVAGLLLALLALGSLYYWAHSHGYDSYLSLGYFQDAQEELQAYRESHFWETVGIYTGIYIFIATFSIPGAAILTLGGGMLFGLLWGTIIVSFASTIGATFAFWISRFLFRNYFESKFQKTLHAINTGIQKEGAFYLFALRLVPLFPFFAVNAMMGLTSIRSGIFFLASQVGMLPGTIAYVNAGKEISKIESLGSILSPSILIAFAILGIIPLLGKWFIAILRKNRIYKKYKKPKFFDYNLIVIGAGSAGLVSAYIASVLKAKVALIEKNKMGGDCLNTGCVPSKTLIKTSKILAETKRCQDFGLKEMQVSYDFQDIMAHIKKVISEIEPHDSIERYTKLGVDCIQGTACIKDPYTVKIDDEKEITAKSIIVATGGRPFVPKIPGIEDSPYYTSDTIWDITFQPKHLIVLGGGPIGCEIGQCFKRLGSSVTIIQRNKRILPKEDLDASVLVHEYLSKEGIVIETESQATSIRSENGKHTLSYQTPEGAKDIVFDALLVSIGRKTNLKNIGLEKLGITVDEAGHISHSKTLATSFPNIYICGDALGMFQFTHTAAHQAWYASVNALFRPWIQMKADHSVIPWCTFTDPEIARVGLTEQEAKEQNISYNISKYDLSDLDRAITDREHYGFVKILTPPGKDKILGATIVGSRAGEMIPEFILAMKHGIGLNKILGTIHIYPTYSEANKYAAGIWKSQNAPQKALKLLKKWHAFRRRG